MRVSLGAIGLAGAAGCCIGRNISLEPRQYLCLQKSPVEVFLSQHSCQKTNRTVRKLILGLEWFLRPFPISPNFPIYCKCHPWSVEVEWVWFCAVELKWAKLNTFRIQLEILIISETCTILRLTENNFEVCFIGSTNLKSDSKDDNNTSYFYWVECSSG